MRGARMQISAGPETGALAAVCGGSEVGTMKLGCIWSSLEMCWSRVSLEFLGVTPADSRDSSDWGAGWGIHSTVLDTVNSGGVAKMPELVRWIGEWSGCVRTSSDVGNKSGGISGKFLSAGDNFGGMVVL